MLCGDVDFKRLSDLSTNSHMVPFLTHIDGIRANLFSINPRQKYDSQYGKSTVVLLFFFTLKLDATNSFPSNTTEVRHIYLKMGHIMRQPVFVKCEQQRRRSACASTLYSSIVSNLSVLKASYRYMYIFKSLSFNLQERCTPILFPYVDVFVINLFHKI